MNSDDVEMRRRDLPHWTLEGGTYFITFRTAGQVLAALERDLLLAHVRSGDPKYYVLYAAVVMPDHVHLLLQPNRTITLPRIMKGIKGASARSVNAARGSTGTVWQDESWDRIIRDADDFQEKLNYMAENPIKAELAETADKYPWWYWNGTSA